VTGTTAVREVGGLIGSGTNVTRPVPVHGSSSDVGMALATPYRFSETRPDPGAAVGGGGPKNTPMVVASAPVNPAAEALVPRNTTLTD
jgi:hypothetical protein